MSVTKEASTQNAEAFFYSPFRFAFQTFSPTSLYPRGYIKQVDDRKEGHM